MTGCSSWVRALRPRRGSSVGLLLAVLSACGSPSGSTIHSPAAGQGASPTPSPTPDEADDMPTPSVPANVHVVVFFTTERGREHLDVRVITGGQETYIDGVRADDTRAHPIGHRIALDEDQRRTYGGLIAALARVPRCEPLARLPDEPLFRIESREYNDEGPSLWFRENGDRMIAGDDPCVASARLAHFVYTTWMSQGF